jgi:hypothetical protein
MRTWQFGLLGTYPGSVGEGVLAVDVIRTHQDRPVGGRGVGL